MNKEKLGLYLHIPFCIKKCAYCDFLSRASKEEEREDYVRALIGEIQSSEGISDEYQVDTIFLGGGTPSLLQANQMTRIMEAVYQTFQVNKEAEITIEVNPGTVDNQKLRSYKEMGINRISFGLQSTDDTELAALGRIHTYQEFLESYRMAREIGFANINIDLISGIPKQTYKSWMENLKAAAALSPEHISAYSLIVEEGTLFYTMHENGALDLPTEEEERLMYEQTAPYLEEQGYRQYEISNYAKPGMECRHNCRYWERKDYLGLGIGAASLIHETRFSNTEDIQDYLSNSQNLRAVRKNIETLDRKAQIEEYLFLGLRMNCGISKTEFRDCFHANLEEFYPNTVEQLLQEGFLVQKEDRISLSRKGISLSNRILAEFLL